MGKAALRHDILDDGNAQGLTEGERRALQRRWDIHDVTGRLRALPPSICAPLSLARQVACRPAAHGLLHRFGGKALGHCALVKDKPALAADEQRIEGRLLLPKETPHRSPPSESRAEGRRRGSSECDSSLASRNAAHDAKSSWTSEATSERSSKQCAPAGGSPPLRRRSANASSRMVPPEACLASNACMPWRSRKAERLVKPWRLPKTPRRAQQHRAVALGELGQQRREIRRAQPPRVVSRHVAPIADRWRRRREPRLAPKRVRVVDLAHLQVRQVQGRDDERQGQEGQGALPIRRTLARLEHLAEAAAMCRHGRGDQVAACS